ncbi:MAG: hypothetical protein JW725_02575 [Candidatus Babeliaceae bacterium]|nr:hypothetical protein [Candidatus Babeliaceae bacterium]
MNNSFLVSSQSNPSGELLEMIDDFLDAFTPYEIEIGSQLVLYFDKRSGAYYFNCHLDGNTLVSKCDLEASIDSDDEDEIYKLNRDITEDKAAYKLMEQDAFNGRSFEDLVIEYDTTYREQKPLKVYGGQHRIRAITNTIRESGNSLHGIRVYFHLSREQKVEIATVNNTSIAVPNDLLDRMREQLLGSELRDWCQAVGLLAQGEDFSDRRDQVIPTVRIARTLIVNYYRGLQAQDDDFHQPVVCKSGGIDEDYDEIRKQVGWNDPGLLEMGRQFARLHQLQRQRVNEREQDKNAEFARKALSLSIVASWAYAAGLFQRNAEYLRYHYLLPDSVSAPADPLNAKDLSEARLKGTDPDTYRGLGTRNNSTELGRMLEVFLVLATRASKKRITKQLANAAIQSYEAKRATYQANKVLGRI